MVAMYKWQQSFGVSHDIYVGATCTIYEHIQCIRIIYMYLCQGSTCIPIMPYTMQYNSPSLTRALVGKHINKPVVISTDGYHLVFNNGQ